MFSIRVVVADSYQAAPIPDVDPTFSHFRGSEIRQVPVIRVFGITPDGTKVCLHIHGVFPYLYVPYTGQVKVDILAYQLATALDAAINVSLGSAKANTQHVYKIQQVSGIPIYGYHRKKHHFIKIYFYNPAIVKRATDLLQCGSVLEQNFQPYEAHIPFVMQFMIDYNIYGMSMLNLKSIKYRRSSTPSQTEEKLSNNSSISLNQSSAQEKEYLPFVVTKQSVCKLEVDAWASDILNREVIDKGIDLNPGIAAIWEEEKARRAQAGLGESQLTNPKSPERSQGTDLLTDNDIYQQTRLAQRLCVLESQLDETSLTPSSEYVSYPIPVPDNSNLLNASQVEIHAGPLDSSFQQRSFNETNRNVINESIMTSSQSQYSFSDVSLNSSDLDVAEMLANLAREQECDDSHIDSNSILGSQRSQINLEDIPLAQNQNDDEEEEEEDVPDLNLTNLELDNLNMSSWESFRENSQSLTNKSEESPIELALESLNDPQLLNLPDNIPQVDGPIDDENARISANDDNDVTIERREFVICEYRSERGRTSPACVTPHKRKRVSSSEDDDSNDGTKKKKTNENLPKTPRRTPRRSNNLASPSCPSRTYSPLSVEVRSRVQTPKTPETPKTPNTSKTPLSSPCASLSVGPSRQTIRRNLGRKMIFSPVKESEEEEEEEGENEKAKEKEKEKRKEREERKEKEYFSTTNSKMIPASTISEELFTSEDHKTPDSDDTLVEDSDDSLKTVVPSPPEDIMIINESDSNDSTSFKNKQSSLSYSFPHNTLHTVEEESKNLHEMTFSQILESKQKEFSNKSEGIQQGSESDSEKLVLPPIILPPSKDHIVNPMDKYGLPKHDNVQPFFSRQEDADAQPQSAAKNALYRARGLGVENLPAFRSCLESVVGLEGCRKIKIREVFGKDVYVEQLRKPLATDELVALTPIKPPPSRESVEKWFEEIKQQKKEKDEKERKVNEESVIRDASQKSEDLDSLSMIFKGIDPGQDASKHLGVSCGQIEFSTRLSNVNRAAENLCDAKALTVYQFLTVLCVEVHVVTKPNFLPDPATDEIVAIFYAVHNDVPPDWSKVKPLECGAIIVDSERAKCKNADSSGSGREQRPIIYVENELGSFEKLLGIIDRCDPEILIGWDLEFLSWGYIFQRASICGKNLSGKISRIPNVKCNWEAAGKERDMPDAVFPNRQQNIETIPEVRLPGRIVLDIWRIMKSEIALTSYTYENIMYHVLNERVPHYSFDTLTKWWESPLLQWRVIDHYTNKVVGVHRIIHHLDIINRSTEEARLLGLQFYEVFSRGSQYRVESMMLRLAKPLNFIPVSPSHHQRGCMRAPESLPLIMEPESTMYCDPVIVLDFQSLYPSIIIAYNYCFSTCLGRIEHIGSPTPFEFGCTTLKVPKNLAMKLQGKINFSPCGVAFVKEEVRKGILPRMLTEILETRFMVKKAIKDHPKEDRALQRVLHSRQLGLKLIANVTYGYTAANFSGRMPCIEVGDSVVSKGKETLERAIRLVESTPKWKARVIYGDTDSLFILLKGRSKEEAFTIGAEMADAVTAVNPKPVKLKFEKVMMPCILQTKKRYCGYMYESLNDKPVYLAKGIETVRRDGCPAAAKILEKSLKILFDTKDVSLVKDYVVRQLDKILTGRASIQDLIFAKEFRGMKGYKAAACVPALELTKRLVQKDPRAIPRNGSRVPYVIVAGGPNEPLIRCVRAPMELIMDPSLRPNATYYITKVVIPPLNRCLNLIGVDAFVWFMDMPHRQNFNRVQGAPFLHNNRKQKTTISQYLCNTTCPSCGQTCDRGICASCVKNQSRTLIILHEKCRQYERIYSNIKMMCESCIGMMDAESCISLDCPIFYRRIQAQRDNMQVSYLNGLMQCMEHF